MTAFTPAEITFLQENRLGRLATIGPGGEPHVVPLRYLFNADLDTLDLIGYNITNSKKWRDVGKNPRVAFVVDDILPDPRTVRGVEVRGTAELLPDQEIIRITPARIVSWGIDTHPHHPNSRKVNSQEAAERNEPS